MDLSPILETFKIPGGVSVTRRAAGTLSNGIVSPGTSSVLTFDPAVVHPATGRDLAMLPEGQRTSETIVVFTRDALRTAAEPAGVLADLVAWCGASFEVHRVGDWNANAGYYRALAVKVPA